jgi:flagellar protein FliS
MNTYGQRQYKHTQVTTVDKGRLIVLLYEGAINFLRQAKESVETGDIAAKSNNINRALDIIAELNQSLNMNEGGEISSNLRKLYLFWSEHLIQAKIRKDTKHIDDVIGMLNSLNEAWNYAVSQPEAQDLVPKSEPSTMRTQVRI